MFLVHKDGRRIKRFDILKSNESEYRVLSIDKEDGSLIIKDLKNNHKHLITTRTKSNHEMLGIKLCLK